MSRKWWKIVKGDNVQSSEDTESVSQAPHRGARNVRNERGRNSEHRHPSRKNAEGDLTEDPEISEDASQTIALTDSAPDSQPPENENIFIPDQETAEAPAHLASEEVEGEDNEEEEEVEEDLSTKSALSADLPEDDYEDFETVYDLDRGSTFRGSDTCEDSSRVPWNNKIETAKEFFNAEILYRFDILNQADKEELSGTYRIELRVFKGGIWTMRLANHLEVSNRREEADVVLSMRQSNFLQIINGEVNPQLAILAKKVRITGNVRRALAFQKLLAPVRD